jgi:RimJ/RimL family protein N-acetyltransferase
MINQDFISPEEQIDWFKTLHKKREHHFIYSHGIDDVGLVSIKTLDSPGFFEAGIFCGRTDYLGNAINIAAAIGLYDYGFEVLGHTRSRARVLRANSSALRMNKSLGYELISEDDEKVIELELTRENFELNKSKLLRFVDGTFAFR